MNSYRVRLGRAIGVWLCAVGFVAAQTNLLPDGGFEGPLSDTGLPVGLNTFQAKDATIKATVVAAGRTGKALRIEAKGAHAGVGLKRLPVAPRQQLALRGWVRVEGGENTRAVVKLDYLRADGSWLAMTSAEPVTSKQAGWQLVALTDLPEAVTDAAIVCPVVAVEGDGCAWFDDMEMVSRPVEQTATNLLQNGDFEWVAAGQPRLFGLSRKPREAAVVCACSDREPRTGWYSLQLSGNVNYAVAYGPGVTAVPGRRYVLKGFARSSRGDCRLKLDYVRDGVFLGQTVSPRISGMEWQELTVVSEVERYPEATRVAAAAVIEGDAEAWFDDLVLTIE